MVVVVVVPVPVHRVVPLVILVLTITTPFTTTNEKGWVIIRVVMVTVIVVVVPISRKSKVLLMCPLIWNDTCDDYEYDCDCDDNVDMRDENMISVDDHNNNYDVPQSIGSPIYRI
mmetsp:Transcript_16073/g.18533  ORF Transcript_16073/g.18533 Transcript_16073/m.18533 type:complete len:115 (+) Transcript_16073:687-1031(+)